MVDFKSPVIHRIDFCFFYEVWFTLNSDGEHLNSNTAYFKYFQQVHFSKQQQDAQGKPKRKGGNQTLQPFTSSTFTSCVVLDPSNSGFRKWNRDESGSL